ncbi:TDP-N-acetylfucosamine:lipid II N-acetylfucosaminyltransferase [Pseudoalteromonas sp. MEBiC 03485]|uniref:TDP-N-acetylfucosamine:lipid II N-acetylfucosaminyltransferase n=1 Tax=Pseudoalteromonas sp. MEBiC 03485 TaxID=2571103 RepID=UPI0010203A81|nr:TDP-N-acetylfucosamine:lipid II N-acetylfucosaminyltransferase [Pseudoalteromonas sp. MEBiC 03485]RZD21670.1 4-alpha-L-fucosyltransferase [Pseudoalteromonas sp. MEBiC 03485]
MTKRIIHIFADTPHHYKPMQQFFEQQCRPDAEQLFWVKTPESIPNFVNYKNNAELFALLESTAKEDQIVFHGSFDMHVWKKLLLSSVTKRCSCVLWGAELYRHTRRKRTIKERVVHVLHALVINRYKQVFALNKGDAKLAQRVLFKRNVKVLPYPLIGMKVEQDREQLTSEKPLKILVGNSASASNNHIDALNKLAHLANENIEIIMPLNYGGEQSYIDEVVKHATTLFGDKFIAITEMLNKQDYDKLLNDVHLTVFAQHRQQGLYVAYAMLLMGKPMFLLSDTSSYNYLTELGFEIYKTDEVASMSYSELNNLISKDNNRNPDLMNQHFTEQALAPKWRNMLEQLHG